MSLFHLDEWDALKTCPYDKSHRVTARKYTTHIIKCQRNHTINLAVCPFNASHRFPELERQDHLENCPDRVILERDIVTKTFQHIQSLPAHKVNAVEQDFALPQPKEDWDLECSGSPIFKYDVSTAMSQAKFRNPATLSRMKPAEKKEFHKNLFSESCTFKESAESNALDLNVKVEQLRVSKGSSKPDTVTDKPTKVYLGLSRGRLLPTSSTTGTSLITRDAPHTFSAFSRGRGLAIRSLPTSAESNRPGARLSNEDKCHSRQTSNVEPNQFDDADLANQLSRLNFQGNGRESRHSTYK